MWYPCSVNGLAVFLLLLDRSHALALGAAKTFELDTVVKVNRRRKTTHEDHEQKEDDTSDASTVLRNENEEMIAQRRRMECHCKKIPLLNLSSVMPNVWIFGDSISSKEMGYFNGVHDLLLQERVDAHFGSGGVDSGAIGPCGSSNGVVPCLHDWLGGSETIGKFDVISFNWGLHDVAPSMYEEIGDNKYVDNMKLMYSTMKMHLARGGKLVWQSSTPVPPSSDTRQNSDVLRLNSLAEEAWANNTDLEISDLYDDIIMACHANHSTLGYPKTSSCQPLQQRDDVHFSERGNDYLSERVANSILLALSHIG